MRISTDSAPKTADFDLQLLMTTPDIDPQNKHREDNPISVFHTKTSEGHGVFDDFDIHSDIHGCRRTELFRAFETVHHHWKSRWKILFSRLRPLDPDGIQHGLVRRMRCIWQAELSGGILSFKRKVQ